MNISEFTARLLLLFLPGIISVLIVNELTVQRDKGSFKFIIHAFIFGALSYALYALLWSLNSLLPVAIPVSWWPAKLTILQAFVDTAQHPNLAEIILATVCAIPVALAYSAAANYKLLHTFANVLRISKRYGDPDVWGFLFNLRQVEWVVVRDIQNDLAYEGWVRAFSDGDSPRELLLFDVDVYKNETGEELYRIDALYVSRKNEDWTVEVREIAQSESGRNRNDGKATISEANDDDR